MTLAEVTKNDPSVTKMNREPVALYIFRLLIYIALLAFAAMLYWSTTIVQDRLEDLNSSLSSLRGEISQLQSQVKKSRGDTAGSIESSSNTTAAVTPLKGSSAKEPPSVDSQYPNLLNQDPFYEDTLPKILGPNFIPSGVQHVAMTGKPDNLHPFSNWIEVSNWRARCSISVSSSAFGKYEDYVPSMAVRMEQRPNPKTGVPEFWIFLRNDVYWQPLKQEFFSSDTKLAPQFLQQVPVTAYDFKFFIDAIMNPYVQEPGAVAYRTLYNDLENVEVIDPQTFVVRWKANPEGKIKYVAKQYTGGLRPLPCHVYQYFSDGKKIVPDDADPDTYRTNSVWAQNFSLHWAKNVIPSCGAWTFDGWTDRQINLVRTPNYFNTEDALTKGYECAFKDSPDNIWQAFKNNSLDSYSIQPTQLKELQTFLESAVYKQQAEAGAAIKRLDYIAQRFYYIGWNEARPYFKSAKVRQAMTMAIDRRRIIQDCLNGYGVEITGTFFPASPSHDTSIIPLPFDPLAAKRILEEEGWYDSDGDGIIDREIDGKRVPFSFSITYFVKNPLTKTICEYTATALRQIGIDCHLNGVDVADLSAVFDDKNFDALCMAWVLATPPENPRQLWHSSGAKEKGSSNSIGFANKRADEIIDKLDYEYDAAKRIKLYHEFDRILHEEQPYTFLFAPKTIFVYREYVKNVFIPVERQDLVPGATVAEPDQSIFWLEEKRP